MNALFVVVFIMHGKADFVLHRQPDRRNHHLEYARMHTLLIVGRKRRQTMPLPTILHTLLKLSTSHATTKPETQRKMTSHLQLGTTGLFQWSSQELRESLVYS